MQLNKQHISILILLCGLIPKTAVTQNSTMIFITEYNNEMIIYGGDISNVRFIYYTHIQILLNITVGIIAYTFALALKNIKHDIDIEINTNYITWIERNDTTNLKLITINNNLEYLNIVDIIPLNIKYNDFESMIYSINIKIDISTKCYIHITNEFIRLILVNTGRLSISKTINYKTNYNIFASCNYNALLSILPLLNEEFDLYIINNILVLKQINIELHFSIIKSNFINYTKYLNNDNNILTVATNEIYNTLKSLMCINKSQTEIVTLTSNENKLILECYNPNIGNKKIMINIIQGTLNRILKFNLIWLLEAIKTIDDKECNLRYGDMVTNPLIIHNIHVIAPIVSH